MCLHIRAKAQCVLKKDLRKLDNTSARPKKQKWSHWKGVCKEAVLKKGNREKRPKYKNYTRTLKMKINDNRSDRVMNWKGLVKILANMFLYAILKR